MKVLIVNDWKTYSGSEKIIQTLVEGLKNRGHEVIYLVRPANFVFKKTLREFKPDIVNFHNIIATGVLPVLVAKKTRVPILQSLHDYWIGCRARQHFRMSENRICWSFDQASCLYCPDYLSPFKFPTPEKLRRIYEDIDFQVPSNYFKEIVQHFGYPEERVHVVYRGIKGIGGPVKDSEYILALYSRLPWKGGFILDTLQKELPQFKFVRLNVPSGSIDPSAPEYLPEEILSRYFREASLFLNTSIWEDPGGLTNLEAMSCSKVVLGYKVGSLQEYVRHTLVNNYSELKSTLESLMSDKEKRQKLGQENYEAFKEKFTSERMIIEFEKLLESLTC